MRTGWLALLLMAPLFSGCLSFLDDDGGPDRDVAPAGDVDDPSMITVTDVKVHNDPLDPRNQDTITGHGGVALPYVVYEPLTQNAMPDGSAPTFPVVIFVHGFGLSKEMWLCPPMGEPAQPGLPDDPCPYENLLQRFAEAGFISVAYDTRGFGRADGQVTVVGPDELADLDAVIDWVDARFPTNGKVGVTGISYGGGHAMMAWATNPKVTTAVPHQGWYDLYEALAPGNVPKLEWDAMLVGEGTVASGGQLHPMVYGWAEDAVMRTDLDQVEEALDARSPLGRMDRIDKPLLVCNGLQDTLFQQQDQLWREAGGFTRAIVHEGGHGHFDPTCWDATQDWFSFFLRGVDTSVDAWPALRTVDAAGGDFVGYADFPMTPKRTFYLREPQLTDYSGSNATFTVQQQLLNNPFQEPGVVWDQVGMPNQAVPYDLREDPTAVFFESAPLAESEVLLGSAQLSLVPASGDEVAAFQVTGQLIHVTADGDSRILSRGAYAHVPGVTPDINGTVDVRFHFTKADLAPGDMLVLKLGANDSSWFLPFWNSNDPASSNFSVQFTGHSALRVPFYQG